MRDESHSGEYILSVNGGTMIVCSCCGATARGATERDARTALDASPCGAVNAVTGPLDEKDALNFVQAPGWEPDAERDLPLSYTAPCARGDSRDHTDTVTFPAPDAVPDVRTEDAPACPRCADLEREIGELRVEIECYESDKRSRRMAEDNEAEQYERWHAEGAASGLAYALRLALGKSDGEDDEPHHGRDFTDAQRW